ncbi:sodium- and chloride-dependent taurine transporter-like isoform X5 [Sipha flava]|uniref:Transporter n=1 Tax=Sipha flava TaxID=143950 RepID=A0A8B8FJY0_9HEMI|nr:sodium- and chloride-dependent taurine transporter-like isoform X5 [Sipha flava]
MLDVEEKCIKLNITYEQPRSQTPQREQREEWGNKLDFLFSCISVSVGLGNVWRFPYLCYKHGGGAFLVTYFIAMVFCGIPIFFQEVAIGQYLGSGGMTLVGKLCPILSGTGYATMTIVFLLDVYYCVIVAWTFFYLASCFLSFPDLPWESCNNWWNTENCLMPTSFNKTREYFSSDTIIRMFNTMPSILNNNLEPWNKVIFNRSYAPKEEFFKNNSQFTDFCHTIKLLPIDDLENFTGIGDNNSSTSISQENGKLFNQLRQHCINVTTKTPAEEYWERRVLMLSSGIEDIGGKGLSQSGKSSDIGRCWRRYQISDHSTMGKSNEFRYLDRRNHTNFLRLQCRCRHFTGSWVIQSVSSQLLQGSTVNDVVESGPGLVFITYPQVVLQLPGARIWAIIFFVMLAMIGIDSEFCNVESFITGLTDKWSKYLHAKRKTFTMSVCMGMFVLSSSMVTNGGMYIFQLMDMYSASGISLLWVCFFQTVAISWFFGADRFRECINQMLGFRPNLFWYICWVYLAPFVMITVFIFYVIKYEPVMYGTHYRYPWWGEGLGITISLMSMIWIPLYAVYYLMSEPGTLKQKLQRGLTPIPEVHCRIKIKKESKNIVDKGLQLMECSTLVYCDNNASKNI